MAEPEVITLEKQAGDDWVFPFQVTDVNEDPEDLTGRTYEAVLIGPKPNQTRTISMGDGASLADQTKPETIGYFFIKVSRNITKTIPNDAPQQQNLNTQIKGIPVLLRVAEYDTDGNRKTLGTIRILTKR